MARIVVASYPRCTNMLRAASRIFWRVWTRSRCRRSRLGTDFVITWLYHITTLYHRQGDTRSNNELGRDDVPGCAGRTRASLLPRGGIPDNACRARPPRLGIGRPDPLYRSDGREASLYRRRPGTCPRPAAHPEDPARHVPASRLPARAAVSGLRPGLPGARLFRHPEGGVLIGVLRHCGGAVS